VIHGDLDDVEQMELLTCPLANCGSIADPDSWDFSGYARRQHFRSSYKPKLARGTAIRVRIKQVLRAVGFARCSSAGTPAAASAGVDFLRARKIPLGVNAPTSHEAFLRARCFALALWTKFQVCVSHGRPFVTAELQADGLNTNFTSVSKWYTPIPRITSQVVFI
jgi:hypothetical protein